MAGGVQAQIAAGRGSGASGGMAEEHDTYEVIDGDDDTAFFVVQLVILGMTTYLSILPSNIAPNVFITSFVFALVTVQSAGILVQALANKPAPMPRLAPLCKWWVGITVWLLVVAYFLDYVHLTSVRAMRPISGGDLIAVGVASFCNLVVVVCIIRHPPQG